MTRSKFTSSDLATPHGCSTKLIPTTAYATTATIIELVNLAHMDERFDHRDWSLLDAEALESLARAIREGYAKGGGS